MSKSKKPLEEARSLVEGRYDVKSCSWKDSTKAEQKKGIAILNDLADAGDSHSQCQLGRYYLMGNGVAQDDDAGILWLKKAAEQGFDEAQYWLGQFHLERYTGFIDRREETLALALLWMKKSADQGCWMALLNDKWKECTLDYQEKCEEEFKEALEAAEVGDPFAQERLWICYLGGCGVKKDEVKAQYWREKSEAQRDKVLEIVKKKADEGEDWAIAKYHAMTSKLPLEDMEAFQEECNAELERLLQDPPPIRSIRKIWINGRSPTRFSGLHWSHGWRSMSWTTKS